MEIPADLHLVKGLVLFLKDGTFLLCPHIVEEKNRLPQASFIKSLILFMQAPSS